jgi:hypothetical protein
MMTNERCSACTYFNRDTKVCVKYQHVVKQPNRIWNPLCFIPRIDYAPEEVENDS